MALPLETQIMQEIGLGMPYNYYNGSGSCGHIRRKAVEKLPDIIRNHHLENAEGIAMADPELMRLLGDIADHADDSQYQLTKTWEACSYVIAWHIGAASMTDDERKEAFSKWATQLSDHYKARLVTLEDLYALYWKTKS